MRCARPDGGDEVFSVSNPGGREESCRGGHGMVVVKILTFPRWGVSYGIFESLDVEKEDS